MFDVELKKKKKHYRIFCTLSVHFLRISLDTIFKVLKKYALLRNYLPENMSANKP